MSAALPFDHAAELAFPPAPPRRVPRATDKWTSAEKRHTTSRTRYGMRQEPPLVDPSGFFRSVQA